jgi:PKD repeat protein
MNIVYVVCPILIFLLFQLSFSEITPVIEPNLTVGVAPLAVFFDAAQTTGTSTDDPFHELEYYWEFDDPGSGNWVVNGLSRNMAYGPMAGHVFETPGYYTVSLTVRDAVETSIIETLIEVQDPDTVFSGTNTICFSVSGDFTEAPQGAMHVTTSDFYEIIGYMEAGKRLLLRRGESWTAGYTGFLNIGGPGVFGAFGPGESPDDWGIYANNPILDGAAFSLSSGIKLNPDSVNTYDWRFQDIVITGAVNDIAITSSGEIHNILFLRMKIHNCYTGISLPGSVLAHYNANHGQNHQPFNGISIINCRFYDFYMADMYACIERHLLLGSEFTDSDTSHITRFPYLNKAVISSNYMSGSRDTGHLIKLHGPPWAGNALYDPGTYSEDILISDNMFEGDIEDWPVAIAPMNAGSFEYVRDVIVERNHFLCNLNTAVALYLSCYETTIRNNIIQASGYQSGRRSIEVTNRNSSMPVSDHISIYNNTFYSEGGYFTVLDLEGNDFVIKNNIAFSPDGGLLGGIGDVSNNLMTSTNPFVSSSPSQPYDFRLQSGCPAVDDGIEMTLWHDYLLNPRPNNGIWDIGAMEYYDTTGISLNPDCFREEMFTISRIYPNPFSSSTRVMLNLETGSNIRLSVYNISGQLVRILADHSIDAGSIEFSWNGRDENGKLVENGIYFVHLRVFGTGEETAEMILIR